eukprot:CAMPEP_0184856454 /NCGR_PEP_ID=MMETSP0580-20130426/1648_1 /TAXON_ID=1118495 /ORGANISM="Dactyliosolen fragilissimus" /LENGTH=62 /DNA_ID=CAMNT_0027351507 /DNA_START=408 /DNA_END=597 /DNA_ORIENTATION=+
MTTDPGSVPPDAKPIYDDVDGAYAEGKDDGTTPKPKQLKRCAEDAILLNQDAPTIAVYVNGA